MTPPAACNLPGGTGPQPARSRAGKHRYFSEVPSRTAEAHEVDAERYASGAFARWPLRRLFAA